MVLFIITSIAPLSFGINIELKDQKTNSDLFLESYYSCYSLEEIPESIRPIVSEDDVTPDISKTENFFEIEDSPKPLNDPLDSPWPMHCHDTRHTGRSSYDTTNTWGEIWYVKDEIYYMRSSPVISNDGTIYCGALNIYAINPNGTIKWKQDLDGYIWSAPAIDENGTIYFGVMYGSGKLYAYYPNGTIKWKYNVGDNIQSSPAIDENGIIYFGSDNKKVYALYPNGTLKWKYTTGHLVMSSPGIGNDGTIYIGSIDEKVYAINPNGTLKWKFNTGTWVHGSATVGNDGIVYIGSDDSFYALYPNNGTVKWRLNIGGGIWSTPVIDENGIIYIGGYDGNFYAIYPNGTIKWVFHAGGHFWFGASAAISLEGTLYFASGNFFALYPNGTEKWIFHKGHFSSSPAIGEDGIVYMTSWEDENHGGYIYSKGYLYAFGIVELQAEANGPYYGLIDEPLQFNGKGMGGYSPFSYHWDFGDGHTSEEQNPTHTYTEVGDYNVTLTVTDNTSNTSVDYTSAWIQDGNSPPDKPTIDGPVYGIPWTRYYYQFSTSDPDGTPIYYYIDWDDPWSGDTGWIGPYSSGEQITESHGWTERGKYVIRCKAKDPYGEESEWGELKVTIPRNKETSYSLLLQLLERFPLLQRLLNQVSEKLI